MANQIVTQSDYTVRWSCQKTGDLKEKGFLFELEANRFAKRVKGQVLHTWRERQEAPVQQPVVLTVVETPKAAAYDPGRPTLATQAPDGTWRVPSHRGEDEVYVVNLELRSCSCPSFRHRGGPCKHIRSASEQSVWIEYAQKAARCTDEQLETLLVKYLDDERISGAIRFERARRKQDRGLGQPAPRFEAALDNARARKFAEVAAVAQQEPSEAELRRIFA